MWQKLLYIAACLILPIVWGVLVNWLFNLWHGRRSERAEDESIFPDYQI